MKTTIFIDESGTLPDTQDQVIVVAAVGVQIPNLIDRLFNQTSKQLRKNIKLSEIKFYTAGDKTKEQFFKNLIKEDLGIFVLIVDKKGRSIPDTPQHFALLCWLLLSEVVNFYPQIKEVIFDRHFQQKQDLENFGSLLEQLLETTMTFKHVDSQQFKQVNVADMIAGATLSKIRGKNNKFYEVFKDKIISEITINWPEVKRRFFDKEKTRLNRCVHPSKRVN